MKKIRISKSISNNLQSLELSFKVLTSETSLKSLFKMVLGIDTGEYSKIVVDFSDFFPVSLEPRIVFEIFIESKLNTIKAFVEGYDLGCIMYMNSHFDVGNYSCCKSLHRLRGDEIVLSAFDFHRLVDSYSNGYINDSALIHLYSSPDDIKSYIVPSEIEYSNLLKELQLDSDYYFPLTGDIPESECSVSKFEENTLFHKSYVIEKNSSFLFPFPLFNRELKITKGKYTREAEKTCINCNKCNSFCPVNIEPQLYYHYLRNGLIEDCERLLIKDCTLCGICTFVCPADIPIQKSIKEYFVKEAEDNEGI